MVFHGLVVDCDARVETEFRVCDWEGKLVKVYALSACLGIVGVGWITDQYVFENCIVNCMVVMTD